EPPVVSQLAVWRKSVVSHNPEPASVGLCASTPWTVHSAVAGQAMTSAATAGKEQRPLAAASADEVGESVRSGVRGKRRGRKQRQRRVQEQQLHPPPQRPPGSRKSPRQQSPPVSPTSSPIRS
ncbi:unnamed protein product, partial [Sphacelaria rigidula]